MVFQEVLEDILDTPVSGNPNDIITEVTLVTSVVTAINEEGGEISEQQQEEVIERFFCHIHTLSSLNLYLVINLQIYLDLKNILRLSKRVGGLLMK